VKTLNRIIVSALTLLIATVAFGQADIVKSDGITSPLHQQNIGRVTFMEKPIPIEHYKQTDFLKQIELSETKDLSIRVFMANSLTNYLHRLSPELPPDELVKRGNYRFSFFVDGVLIYTENLHVGAGLTENKNSRTTLRVPLISSTGEDAWGIFMWNRFLMSGGEDALGPGTHWLKIEIRPYLKTTELKVGDLIAEGSLQVTVAKPNIEESQIAIQTIKSAADWKISRDAYDKQKIRELNLKIAQNSFKEITSVVVIKNGKILIEEYFNGATRETLHDTRSVGKSFASTMTGMAIDDGFLKNENQTLREFYDLKKFANYSSKKDEVTIKSLLTMSAGFDADDNDQDSAGNEERMYPTGNWVKFALDLPMNDSKAATVSWSYFTAGVVVLGDILHRSVPDGLEKYAERKLFKPLGIREYKWEYTPQRLINTAGGLRMSSLDFAKFGQLYKNGGRWNGKQIVSRKWVEKTLTKHLKLPNDENGFYGYLFWNKTFTVNDRRFETFFATGNGGNKIFVFTEQPLVIVITATAYNKPYAHPQIDRMMERYILPAIITR
jgi:CubicO group peptidase (beta-lactamase class C family)